MVLPMAIQINTLACMDAFDFLRACIDQGILVDLFFTDPPYNIANDTVIVRKDCANIDLRFGQWDVFASKDAFLQWTFSWIDLATQLIRPGGIFVSFFDRARINFLSSYLEEAYHYKIKNNFTWVKVNPPPQFRKSKWSIGTEYAVIMQKPSGFDEETGEYLYKDLTFNYQLGMHADYVIHPVISGEERTDATESGKRDKKIKIIDDPSQTRLVPLSEKEKQNDGERKTHPTQKPIKVVSPIIEYWSNRGDVVMDCFSGVASIPYACSMAGRKWYACEIDPKWASIGTKRLLKLKGIKRIDEFK